MDNYKRTGNKISKEAITKHLVGIFLMVFITLSGYLASQPQKAYSNPVTEVKGIEVTPTPSEAMSEAKLPQTTSSPVPTNPTNFGRQVKVPVIYYHYIGKNPNPQDKMRDSLSVDPEIFEQQMNYIAKSGYTTITYDTLYGALVGKTILPPKPIILTFDDGYVDFYVNAFPILRKYNLHATEFIPTGFVGSSYYLHWEQIKEMDKSGLMTFQAHTVVHANLPSISETEMLNQMVESKKTLETQLGKPVNFMAYPYGISNANTWQAAKQVGYFGAAGTWGGNIESEGNLFDMPRIRISGGISLENFQRLISE